MTSDTSEIASAPLFIGIDVGTGSVRAALVQKDGSLLSTSSHEIKTWRSSDDHRIFEQSTTDIWTRICGVVKQCLVDAAATTSGSISSVAERVRGIGFDATCSLAVTDAEGKGVIVTEGSELGSYGDRNIILWADHRAEKETEVINQTGSIVLDYVGGRMSLEMEIPKILWLKNHMPAERFAQCQFFDLPDYLTYRATSNTARSCCSLSCKCSYVSVAARKARPNAKDETPSPSDSQSGWDDAFFQTIGLGELVERGYGQIGAVDAHGDKLLTAGMPVGQGLSKEAAEELGLREGTPVGSAVIDAYAGWLGTVGARCFTEGTNREPSPSLDEAKRRMALVAGTSTCHIVQSRDGIFVDGIWGPYKDPIFPGWWMNEGGQSSTGQLIDHIITTHPSYPELVEQAKTKGSDTFEVLHERLESLRKEKGVASYTELTKDLHMYPDFHGNRSPIADSRMRGSIVGLDLDTSLSSLALLYFATLTAIALQTRSIVETLNSKGHAIDKLYVSGSQAKNPILMQLLADACHGQNGTVKGVVITSSDGQEGRQTGVSPVVLGAAMLGRMAEEIGGTKPEEAGEERTATILWNIMTDMTPTGVFIPARVDESSVKERRVLDAKYQIFLESLEIQRKWRALIDDATSG